MTKDKEYFKHVLYWDNQLLWLVLAMHAGYLNAGGFLACHRFVSHMTGFGTQIGVSFGLKEYLIAAEMLLAPLSFIMGAGFAGFLIDSKMDKNHSPRLKEGLLLILLLDIIVFSGGLSGVFGVFGEPLLLQRDFLLLVLLTFTCGLQNGMFVSLTGGQIRTTHITGLSTDIGLNIVRGWYMKDGKAKEEHVGKNNLRIKTFVAFSSGSFVGAICFIRLEYWGFLLSSITALFILIWATLVKSKVKVNG